MRLDEAQKIVDVLCEAHVTAWIQLTIESNVYSVNFIIDRKMYNVNEHTKELFA